jgi:hypothetical protein
MSNWTRVLGGFILGAILTIGLGCAKSEQGGTTEAGPIRGQRLTREGLFGPRGESPQPSNKDKAIQKTVMDALKTAAVNKLTRNQKNSWKSAAADLAQKTVVKLIEDNSSPGRPREQPVPQSGPFRAPQTNRPTPTRGEQLSTGTRNTNDLFLLRLLEHLYFSINNPDLDMAYGAAEGAQSYCKLIDSHTAIIDQEIVASYRKFSELVDLYLTALQEARKPEKDNAKLAQLSEKVTKAEEVFTTSARTTARTLTARYKWAPREAGFDATPAETNALRDAYTKGDTATLLKISDDIVARRPRDPFAVILRAEIRAMSANTPEEIMVCVTDYERAADMVPFSVGSMIFRRCYGGTLLWAGLCALGAAETEGQGKPWGSFQSDKTTKAVAHLAKAYANLESDETGEIREIIATATAFNGDLEGALKQYLEVAALRKDSVDFRYNVARVCSCSGRTDDAMYALETLGPAISSAADIEELKTNPSLERVRKEKPAEFADLVAVKWKWSVRPGVSKDDVVITNLSKFTITNVSFHARFEAGEQVWTPETKIASIGPGESFTWRNALELPKIKLDRNSASLTCDQAGQRSSE